ncbi:MAG: hypothetical protein H6722_26045 [Sandaracinus sp.]|nr:hypothetical protein [Sandaracinus sp.]
MRRWYGRRCDLDGEPRHLVGDWTNNNGPSMHDLDEDGVPEVIWDRFVYDSDGCVLNPGASYTNYLRLGLFSVIADVDADDAPELVRPDGVYRWTGSDWEREAYWAPTDVANAERLGHVAVADFGDFEGSTPGHAEIVVASAPSSSSPATDNGTVRVMTLEGRIVFGPIALPADGGFAGRGGPPTVGDFDGDGRREVAVAGGSFYTVFDLDCDVDAETAPGCTRVAGLPRGVLWSRPSQDRSSNVTGIERLRFRRGRRGRGRLRRRVLLAHLPRHRRRGALLAQRVERHRLRAAGDRGRRRRLQLRDRGRDDQRRLVPSHRPDLHARHLDLRERARRDRASRRRGPLGRVATDLEPTRVFGHARARRRHRAAHPRRGAKPRGPDLNNFRMNAQGDLERRGAADLTVSLADEICGATGETTLGANVCNRGTNPVPDGARVVFYVGDPMDETIACETTLPRLLDPGVCTEVGCPYTIPEGERPDVTVVVDPDGEVFECRDGNNRGVIPAVFCGLI